MNILSWLVFGALAGIIANIIDPRPARGGLVGAVILGILGAVLGGLLANLFLGVGITGFDFGSLAVSVIGAIVLLFVGRLYRRLS